jgi:hypothetical protein
VETLAVIWRLPELMDDFDLVVNGINARAIAG